MIGTPGMMLVYMWLAGEKMSFDRFIDHGVECGVWANMRYDRLQTEVVVVIVCNVFCLLNSSAILTVVALLLLQPVTTTVIAGGYGT